MVKPLTTREQQVHRLYAMGYSGQQMADALGISRKTVKNHVSSIIRKTKGSEPPRVILQSETLTLREEEVLRLAAVGMTNAQIAKRLHIKPETVKFHVTGILRKSGATSRTEAVWRSLERGLINAPRPIRTRTDWWGAYHWGKS